MERSVQQAESTESPAKAPVEETERADKASGSVQSVPKVDGARIVSMVQKTFGNRLVQRALSGGASGFDQLLKREVVQGVSAKGETPSTFESNAAMQRYIAEMARRAESEAPPPAEASRPPAAVSVQSLRGAVAASAREETADRVSEPDVHAPSPAEEARKPAQAESVTAAEKTAPAKPEPEAKTASTRPEPEAKTASAKTDPEAKEDSESPSQEPESQRSEPAVSPKAEKRVPTKASKRKKPKRPAGKKAAPPEKDAVQTPKEEMDALKAKQERLQAQLDGLGEEMASNQEELEEIQEDVAEVDAGLQTSREDLKERKAALEKKAEKAREKKKDPPDPDADSTVRSLTQKTEVDLPAEKKDLEDDATEVQEDNAELQEEQAGVQEELEAVNKRLSELQAKSGGGGGRGPVAEPNIAKTSAKLLGLLTQTTKPKLEREAKDAERKQKALEKTCKTCDADESAADQAIATAGAAVGTANGTINGGPGKLAARKKVLDTEAGEGKEGNAATDPNSQSIRRAVNLARGRLRIHTNRLTAAKAKKTRAIETRKKTLKKLDEAKKKVKESKEKLANLAKTLGQLAPPGAGMWEALAAEFEVTCTPIPLAPGETNEAHGHEAPPDPAEAKKDDAGAKAKASSSSERAQAAKGTDPKDTDKAPEKAKSPQETAAEKKERRDETIMAEVSATQDLPPEERAQKWAQLQSKHKLTREQMEGIHTQRVDAALALAKKNQASALSKNKGAKYKDQASLWKASGLSPTQIKVLQAANARKALHTKALAMVGGADGQAAVDKLHAMGASRGMRPSVLVNHLQGVDPDNKKLSPEMRAAAKKARSIRAAEIAKITPKADRLAAEKAHKTQIQSANKSEKSHQDTQDLAKSMNCDPKRAKSYVDRMVESTGCSREAAVAALKNKKTSKTPMAPKAVQAELARIRALKPADRAAAMASLSGRVDPQQLVGATMIPTETDPDGLIDGPMGNASLKNQIADINKLPKAEQAAAWRDLGAKTGLNPNKLYAANKRYDRKQRAHGRVFAIQNSAALTAEQKKTKLEELAKTLNLSVDKLKASAANKLTRTRKQLDLARGSWEGIVSADGRSSRDLAQLNKDLKAGKISRAQLNGKLEDIAKRTGIPLEDLKALHGHERFKGQQKEWSAKLNLKPASKASDYVANKAREQGIPPEKVMDWLRYADPSKMSASDKALRGSVDGWHKSHPTDAEKKEAKARKDAGMGEGQKGIKVCIDDAKAKNLTGQAKVDYDQMTAHEAWIRDELDDTFVDEEAIVSRLTSMPTHQLAALMQRFPELRQRLKKEIDNNVGKDKGPGSMTAKLRAAWKKGAAYQTVVAGSAGAKARADKTDQTRQWALDVQQKTVASKQAATALGLEGPDGLDAARSHLKALSLGTGKTYAEAVAHLKNQPGKTPQQVLKEAYTAKSKDGGPSEVLRRRLADINSLPPDQYAKAIESLKGVSGLSDRDLSSANKAMARDNAIAKKIHDLRHLAPEARKAEMAKLAARYGVPLDKLDALEATYADRLAATEAALGDGVLDEVLAGSFKDVDARAAEIAEKTGLPKDEIVRLIASKRDQAFATGESAVKMGDANIEALRKFGDECGRSPEQMLDYLMRAPRSALPEHLQKLKDDLKAKLPAYQNQYSKSEQAALDKLRAKATDPAYLKKASLLKSAIEADDGTKFKEALAKMSPAERALFREQYNARRDRAIQEGGDVPESFEDMVHSTVDGILGIDASGLDGESGQILREIPHSTADAEAQLLASVEAVDKTNPAYVERANGMLAELRKGGEADVDAIKERLKQMTLAERAAFLADYRALQNAAAQRNLTDDKHKLPNLQEVLKGDAEGLRWVVDAQRAAATGIAAADAKETQKTEAAREAATEAAKALGMPRRDAYRLLQRQAKDLKVSIKNALRFLKGEEMVPDADDALSPWLKDQIKHLETDWKKVDPNAKTGDKIGGHTLNQSKIDKEATRLGDFASGKCHLSPQQISNLLKKCNPRELKELDAKLGGKLRSIVESGLKRRHPSAQRHRGHHAGPPTGTLAEINNALHGMEDFRAEEKDLRLIDDAAKMDPRAHADPSTPEGMAQRMAWAATLPAEKRIKAFNELRKAVPVSKMSAQQVMGAYLNGEQGTQGGMLSPTLLAELQRIERLPPDERTEALKTFQAMTGRSPDDLRTAAKETAQKLTVAKQVAEIEKLPADQQLARLNALAENAKMSIDDLQAAYDEARKAGLIKTALKPVGKHVQKELDRIKLIDDPQQRRAELAALAQANGLSQADVLGHLKARLQEGRKKRRDAAAHRKGAQKLDALFQRRDGDALKKQLKAYAKDPAKLKQIAKQMGGMDALRAKLKGQFGAGSDAFLDLDPILDSADKHTPEPKLPDGTNAQMSDEITRLKALGGDWRSALQRSYPDLGADDIAGLEKHAAWRKKSRDLQVEHAQRQFQAELGSGWVKDDRIKELMQRYSHDVLLALAKRMLPGRDLVEEIRSSVGADLSEDFTEKLNQARMMSKLPPAGRAKAMTKARVLYTYDQLSEEINASLYTDDDRMGELLKDCTKEELALLNEKFGGTLASLIADSDNQDLRNTWRKLRDAEVDYSKPANERFRLDGERVTQAYDAIQDQMDDVWASDGDILLALRSLNPRELQALRKAFEADGRSLLDTVQKGLDPDAYAQAVAMVEESDEAMSGTDRQQEMANRCRQLAIADRLKALKKDPKHRGKSDGELYALVEREGSRIDKMAADRMKKIRDSANDIFKAVDGWWNNDTDAMLKTMAALSPEEVEMVKIEYRRHFGRNFDIDVRDEMGHYNREEMKVAEQLMSADPARRVEGLRAYLLEEHRMFDVEDEDMIFNTLESMSVEERTLLVSGYEGASFLERLKEDLGENEAKMVDALTHINPKTGKADANPAIVAAAKMKMNIHGSGDWWDSSAPGTQEEELISELDGLTPAQIREAEAYYNQHLAEGGSTFVADMKGDFGDGRDWDIIEAELRGDKVSADAHRLKWAAQEDNLIGGGTDEALLEKTLKAGKEGRAGRDAAHLAKVRARFNHMFGGTDDRYGGSSDDSRDAFDRMLDDETEGVETLYFKELGKKGEASDEITLLYAMSGAGTDEDKLKGVLEKYYEKTPEERARLSALFQEQSRMLLGKDMSLEDWVAEETSGSEGFDMKLKLMGVPRTPEEKLKIARMRWAFECGEGSAFGGAVMALLDATGGSSTADVLGRNMANLEALFDDKGKLIPGAEDRLEEVVSWQEQDITNYRECKDSVGQAVGDTLAAVGAVAAGILTAGAAWYVMAAAALAAAAAGTMFKAAIKGNSFGWEEGLQDVGAMAIAALTAGMGGGAFKGLEAAAKAASSAFQRYAILALQGAIEGAIESFLNALLTSEEAWKGGDVAFLTHILKSTAIGGFNGAAGAVVGQLLEDGPIGQQIDRIENGNPAAHSAGKHYALRYTNGVLEAATTSALDPENWEAWADGKEIGLADIKKVFVMPAVSAAMKTAKARDQGKTGAEIEADAVKKVADIETEIADLETERSKLSDPAEIEAMDTQIRVAKQDLDDAVASRDFIIEDNETLAERAAAKKRIEAGLDNESDGKMDAMDEAGQTAAMRQLVENMDDEPEIEVLSGGKQVDDDDVKAPAQKDAHYEEVEGGPLDGQRKLDNTDRVIEREALATLRETIIEDGMSKLADDPAEAMKVAHTIADLFDDTPGQTAVAKAIRFEDDPAKAIQAAHDLNEFSKIVDIDPKDMTEDQLRTVAKAAYHLQKRQLDFLAVAEADGIDAARAKYPDLRMRRVEDMDAIGNVLSQKWGNSIAGYVGDADNTAGMTSHQVIGALGLDYSGIDKDSGQFWHSPFLSQDGAYQPFSLDNRVAVVDFGLTPDQIRAAKVAVHKDVVAQLHKDAQLPGEDGEWARKMLDRVHDNAEPELYDADERNLENPHTGTGATRAGQAHMTWGDGGDPSTLNQEQKINPGSSDALPDGATVKILDEDGNLCPVAVMRNGKWEIADGAADLLPEDEFNAFKAKIQEQEGTSLDGSSGASALTPAVPEGLAEVYLAKSGDLEDLKDDIAEDLSGSRKKRAQDVVDIVEHASHIEDAELRDRVLKLAADGNAQDREELLTLLKRGEAALANGLAEVEDAHEGWNQTQIAAQHAAKADCPEHFSKVEPHLGALVPPLPPELEADYILQSNGVIRRRRVDDTNFKLQIDENGRLQVSESSAAPKPDHHAAYAGGLAEEDAARVVALMRKKGLTDAELAELRDYKRRSTNLNQDDEAIVRNTKRFAEIVQGVMDERLPFEALSELVLLGADADAIVRTVARIEAASTEDKVAGSKALGELAGQYFMGRAFPDAVEVEGLCWDSSGTFDQIWQTPSGEFVIVEAKGGGATNSSSVEVDGVRYQQGHPTYAEAILENMIKKYDTDTDPEKKAKLLELKSAWNAGKVRYLQVSQKVGKDGAVGSIDVREYAQYGERS